MATGQPVQINTPIRDRHAKFLEYYTQGDTAFNMKQSALKAGFTEYTSHSHGKKILKTALKRQEELLKQSGKEGEGVIASKLGMTKMEIINHFKFVLEQNRDLNAKLKALAPVLKEQGINLDDEKTQVTVPVLNIKVTERHKEERILDHNSELQSKSLTQGNT